MAHGNDGGGSIRIPASCCGIFGLKPTRGRNPLGPHYGDIFNGLVSEHALTRSVRDSAALLDATSGPDLGDPYCAPSSDRPFIQELGKDPGKLRIAYTTKAATGVTVHDDCIKATESAAKICEDLGHIVENVDLELDGDLFTEAFITLWLAGTAWSIDDWARKTGKEPSKEDFEPLTWALQEMGRDYSASTYLLALQDLQKISREVARYFVDHDLFLTPTIAEPPVPLGTFDSTPDNPLEGLFRSATFVPFTPVCNVTGQPAMSLPLYWNDEGLPVGVHFIGRFGDEATLFRMACQLEKARPWADRRPPLSA